MARVRNTMQLINGSVGKIDVRYDLYAENITDIYDASRNDFDLICNGFRFGYLQGMKAAKAEMKKAGGAYGK